MFQKNQQLSVRITDMTDRGEGIGKSDGFAIFVKDTVPGDLVEVAITKEKKNYAYARLLRVLEASPNRMDSPCPVARACGGCQLQMMRYEAQLTFQEGRVKSALERIGGFSEIRVEPILAATEPFRYRNKAQIPVGYDREGELVAGFYAGRTHSIIPAEDCLLGPEENAGVVHGILDWMRANKVPAYNENTGEGLVRHILIRTSFATGERMVCLVMNGRKGGRECEEWRQALADFPSFLADSLVVNYNPCRTNVILGEQSEVLFGKGFIEDRIGDLTYRVSAESFYQVNPAQTKKLYDKVKEFAALIGEEVVWDLYCGIGTIGLYLAREAKKVIGVEVVPQAVEDAGKNAERNGIGNAEFLCGKAEEMVVFGEEMSRIKSSLLQPDVVVIDPPRKGCDTKLLDTILVASPRKIIYVSCDPATLARDLKTLCSGGYAIRTVQPVSMFPQCVHVETIVLMTKEG